MNCACNLANQRTNVTLSPDGSYWRYQYDGLGQVTNGVKCWPDGSRYAGQQFGYLFDDIGNRKLTTAGGDASGVGRRPAAYTNNLLNQITFRDVPGSNDIIGVAHASATVTVDGQAAYRKGEYFWKELAATNASAVSWQRVTNQAVLAGVTNAQTNSILTPKRLQQFWYDADGNLLSDGVWTNTWDAENRLLRMVSASGVPTNAWSSLAFGYDPQGRRVSKVVSNWTGSAWVKVADLRFVYDGWNLLAVLSPQSSVLQSFTWGLDLGGFPKNAGGVGGLLAVSDSTCGDHFAAFDGNGNVMALISATNAAETARYEYGPFAELLRATGPMVRANPLRFSTKYQDEETGVLYYGYRHYSPGAGRWISRDPIGEWGGKNSCACVGNNPITHWDNLGLVMVDGDTGSSPFPPPANPKPDNHPVITWVEAWLMFYHLMAGEPQKSYQLFELTIDQAKARNRAERLYGENLNKAASCGKRGSEPLNYDNDSFVIDKDPLIPYGHMGKWQLHFGGTMDWQCGKAVRVGALCQCSCNASIGGKATISKTYTFRPEGYNSDNKQAYIQLLNLVAIWMQYWWNDALYVGNLWDRQFHDFGPAFYVSASWEDQFTYSFTKRFNPREN